MAIVILVLTGVVVCRLLLILDAEPLFFPSALLKISSILHTTIPSMPDNMNILTCGFSILLNFCRSQDFQLGVV